MMLIEIIGIIITLILCETWCYYRDKNKRKK